MLHSQWCPSKAFNHSDAAQRVSDTYNLHRIADPHGSIRKWYAAALSDGRSDNVLYESKRDAVRHQHHNEQWYAFIRIGPAQMTPCEAEVFLATARKIYDAGGRMPDPDHPHGGVDVIKRLNAEDQIAQSRGISTNLIIPERDWK